MTDNQNEHSEDDQLIPPGDNTADQPTSGSTSDDEDKDNRSWCYCCQNEDHDQVIACDSKDCSTEWFH